MPLGTELEDGVLILIESGIVSDADISVFFGFTAKR
jgi:hypothetical protein